MKKLTFGPNLVKGIDISDWQSANMPWEKAREDGIRFVTVKTTEGVGWRAKLDTAHMSGARQAGMIVGAYHWFHFGTDPIAQAKNFFENTEYFRYDLPPALDVEWSDGRELVNEADALDVLTCLEEIERLFGETPMIYTSASFFYGMTEDTNAKFKRFTPWICDIVSSPDTVRTPAPWDKVAFRQYTFDYYVPGYTGGKLDGDWFNGTEDELRAFAENRALPGTPQVPIVTPPNPSSFDPFTKEEKMALQLAVNNAGYMPPLIIDGIIGPKTRAGLRWAADTL